MTQTRINSSMVDGLSDKANTSTTGIKVATALATTSGTTAAFTSIPANVRRIKVMLAGVSTNGTSSLMVQLGSGSMQTSGYTGAVSYGGTAATHSAGFIVFNNISAATLASGTVELERVTGNLWVMSCATSASGTACIGSGLVTLSGELDRVQLTTVNGTDTFDAGQVNISWEF